MKMKKLTSIALAAALAIGTFGISVPAKAADNSTDYTITIPATLTVEQAGWNVTDGIKAQVKIGDNFDTNKKLTVTAASTNGWALKSGENTIGYNLATATGTYSSSATPASWEFSADELNAEGGKTNPMGIIVEDYSSKPAGTYQDTVTFTAKVVSASTPVTAITLNKTATTIYTLNGTATETLSVTAVTPDEATDKTYTWSSDATGIATVDENGVVTAVAAGTAHIRATANDGSGVYGECTVTVSDLSAYYSKMVECGCDSLDGKCYNGGSDTFTGQVLSADQAITLAKAKAAATGSNCAVFYGGGMANVTFAKNDGTTGSGRYYYTAADKGLSGYKGYYVSK